MKTLRFLHNNFLPLGAIVLAIMIVVFLASAGPKSRLRTTASLDTCAGANSTTQDSPHLMRTIFCLHNRERWSHGARRLRWNHDLSRVAKGHAEDMVRHHYFAHRSQKGGNQMDRGNHMDRLRAVGYGTGAACWSAGENLYFSQGRSAPGQILAAWLRSRAHRRNILRARWREFGLGVVMLSPFQGAGGMTVVATFGTRSMVC